MRPCLPTFPLTLGTGCLVSGNTERANSYAGLSLEPDTGHRNNVLNGNAGGHVTGGVNLGGNACGAAVCP